MNVLRVAGAQVNVVVGDIAGNAAKAREAMSWAEDQGADVLLLPELAVTGYPPEDLVLRESFVAANLAAVDELAEASASVTTIVGFVARAQHVPNRLDDSIDRHLANAAAVMRDGRLVGVYRKLLLPNYGVFDEDRYFVAGTEPALTWKVDGVGFGISICEDMWVIDGPPADQAAAGAAVLLNINGSPYHRGKGRERAALLADQAIRARAPVVYVNMVGGQDELVFDGDSMVFDGDGTLLYRAGRFTEELFWVDVPARGPDERSPPALGRRGGEWHSTRPVGSDLRGEDGDEEEMYRALVCGLHDYVTKNGFGEVVVGLSGGIDSALTAAIAVDALGPDRVWGVTMPTRYSSEASVTDSLDLAARLGCRISTVPIDDVFASYLDTLAPVFGETGHGVAEENLQARIRGAVLMALSNKYGGMVVATGNKSEMAVGYATLYGDMAGGFSVLKDVFKTDVYRMAHWRNRQEEVIPQSIIDKAPSAELRPDQKDTDSLPEYELLDAILVRYVEEDRSPAAIVADGFDPAVVNRVVSLVDRNEYKRRQAAPGVKITKKAFGRDRRLPITNRFGRQAP